MHSKEGNTDLKLWIASKGAFAVPQNAQVAMFTVSGGRVKIVDIVGEVTVQMAALATNTNVVSNPTVGADANMCATLDVTGDVVGTMYGITGTAIDAMVEQTSGSHVSQADGVVVSAGTVDYKNDQAGATGSCKWSCSWVAVDDGAQLVAA